MVTHPICPPTLPINMEIKRKPRPPTFNPRPLQMVPTMRMLRRFHGEVATYLFIYLFIYLFTYLFFYLFLIYFYIFFCVRYPAGAVRSMAMSALARLLYVGSSRSRVFLLRKAAVRSMAMPALAPARSTWGPPTRSRVFILSRAGCGA